MGVLRLCRVLVLRVVGAVVVVGGVSFRGLEMTIVARENRIMKYLILKIQELSLEETN